MDKNSPDLAFESAPCDDRMERSDAATGLAAQTVRLPPPIAPRVYRPAVGLSLLGLWGCQPRSSTSESTDSAATQANRSTSISLTQAARFLQQAQFSSTIAEIQRVQAIGYDAWLEEQFAMPITTTVRPRPPRMPLKTFTKLRIITSATPERSSMRPM